MATIAGEVGDRLRHESGAKAVPLGKRLHHIFVEDVTIRRLQRIAVAPVLLELTIGVLMVVLIRAPAGAPACSCRAP